MFIAVVHANIFSIASFRVRILVRLVVGDIMILLKGRGHYDRPLIHSDSRAPRDHLRRGGFQFQTTVRYGAGRKTAIPTFFAFFSRGGGLFFITLASEGVRVVRVSGVLVLHMFKVTRVRGSEYH